MVFVLRDPRTSPGGDTCLEITDVNNNRLAGFGMYPQQIGTYFQLALSGTLEQPKVGFMGYFPLALPQ